MKVLISPISLDEARSVIQGGADIVDIKNVKEGSLGAQFPWKIREIAEWVHAHGRTASATLGDLPYKPGTAALAAFGAVHCGVDYIKAGLHGATTYEQALEMMTSIRRAIRLVRKDVTLVAAGYADFRRFDGLNLRDLVAAARDSGCEAVMVDTAIKDGKTLFDALSFEEVAEFVALGHQAGMQVALAGSVTFEHLDGVSLAGADIVGVRGAVCEGEDRATRISAPRTREFVEAVRQVASARN